jgi:hypothetical protein
MLYKYRPETNYETYVKYITAVREVFLDVRNTYALKEYGVGYESLDKDKQKEVRKKYPITLTTKLKEN